MQITIEGTVKEVAALVLELQERRRNESEVSNTYACNLVVKDDDISNIDMGIYPGWNENDLIYRKENT